MKNVLAGGDDGESGRLYTLLGGHIYFQTLATSVELDLFTLIRDRGPLTREQVAEALRIQAKPARILLLGCVTLGLLELKDGIYSNSPLAEKYLTPDAPFTFVPIIRWQQHINYPAMGWFADSVRKNTNSGLSAFPGEETTLYGRLAHNRELETIFQEAMAAISNQVNDIFADRIDLTNTKHLIDVGGGDGTNIITLARRHTHIRASVFDSPTVCEHARRHITEVGLSDRLGAVEGECFKDPFPEGADTILFAHFMTIWSEERDRELFKKAFKALPSGGRVIIFNMMQSDDESGPLTAAMGSPYFLTLATGEGMLYTWNEYETWMKEAGFTNVTRQVLPRDHGIITGTKS